MLRVCARGKSVCVFARRGTCASVQGLTAAAAATRHQHAGRRHAQHAQQHHSAPQEGVILGQHDERGRADVRDIVGAARVAVVKVWRRVAQRLECDRVVKAGHRPAVEHRAHVDVHARRVHGGLVLAHVLAQPVFVVACMCVCMCVTCGVCVYGGCVCMAGVCVCVRGATREQEACGKWSVSTTGHARAHDASTCA
jgi:hypothetical protein